MRDFLMRGAAALALGLLVVPAAEATSPGTGRPEVTRCVAAKPEPHRFVLLPSGRVARAGGVVNMIPAWSPFGLAVNEDGSFIYDMNITVEGLPDPGSLGGFTTYVAWLATPSLDKVKNIGTIANGSELKITADWNKMMVVISAEAQGGGDKWLGPIVLSGRTPSARLENFAGHDLFSTGSALC